MAVKPTSVKPIKVSSHRVPILGEEKKYREYLYVHKDLDPKGKELLSKLKSTIKKTKHSTDPRFIAFKDALQAVLDHNPALLNLHYGYTGKKGLRIYDLPLVTAFRNPDVNGIVASLLINKGARIPANYISIEPNASGSVTHDFIQKFGDNNTLFNLYFNKALIGKEDLSRKSNIGSTLIQCALNNFGFKAIEQSKWHVRSKDGQSIEIITGSALSDKLRQLELGVLSASRKARLNDIFSRTVHVVYEPYALPVWIAEKMVKQVVDPNVRNENDLLPYKPKELFEDFTKAHALDGHNGLKVGNSSGRLYFTKVSSGVVKGTLEVADMPDISDFRIDFHRLDKQFDELIQQYKDNLKNKLEREAKAEAAAKATAQVSKKVITTAVEAATKEMSAASTKAVAVAVETTTGKMAEIAKAVGAHNTQELERLQKRMTRQEKLLDNKVGIEHSRLDALFRKNPNLGATYDTLYRTLKSLFTLAELRQTGVKYDLSKFYSFKRQRGKAYLCIGGRMLQGILSKGGTLGGILSGIVGLFEGSAKGANDKKLAAIYEVANTKIGSELFAKAVATEICLALTRHYYIDNKNVSEKLCLLTKGRSELIGVQLALSAISIMQPLKDKEILTKIAPHHYNTVCNRVLKSGVFETIKKDVFAEVQKVLDREASEKHQKAMVYSLKPSKSQGTPSVADKDKKREAKLESKKKASRSIFSRFSWKSSPG